MNKLTVTLILLLMVALFYTATVPVYADALSQRLGDIQQAVDQRGFVEGIVGIAVPVAGLSLLGLGVYAGFLLLTSEGNPEKLGMAREVLTNAVVGFGMIVLSIALLLIIQNVLNLPGVQP